MQPQTDIEFSDWVQRVVEWAPQDASLPGGLNCINLALNRKRLAEFLEYFWSDSDILDFLLLDLFAVGLDAPISSTGELEDVPDLCLRPFRLWEYIWLYKALVLADGGKVVLDLGGPASHIVMAAALAGNRIHSLDLNARIVEAGRRCAETFQLESYRSEVGDMRDLSSIAPNSVDRIVCCSVLEHLTGPDQKKALSEMARVLAPGGVIGLTFDYGSGAPGANAYLPPPHQPPENKDEVRARYVHSGLEVLGDFGLEDPVGGSLFRTREVSYTVAALFLGKPPLQPVPPPALVHREHSLIADLRIPDLLLRLREKASHDLLRLQGAKAFQQAAEERLNALEEASAELGRLYPELALRQQRLLEARIHAQQLELTAQDRLDALQTSHSELHLLCAELVRREKALLDMQAREQEHKTQIERLQGDLSVSRKELIELRREHLPAYLRRRWSERSSKRRT